MTAASRCRRWPVLLAVLLAGACGAPVGPAGSSAPAPSGAGSVPPASAGAVPPDGPAASGVIPPSRPSGPPKTPADGFSPITVRGTLHITGTCPLLITDMVTWTLLGPAVAGLADGLWIEVVGLPAPQIETACAGSPLQVRSVRGLVPRGHAARRRAASSAVVAGGSGGSP